jgi:hypothetical protein
VTELASHERRGTSQEARLRRALFRILIPLDEKRPSGLVRVRSENKPIGQLVVSQGRLCMAFTSHDTGTAAVVAANRKEGHSSDLSELAVAALASGTGLCHAIFSSGREAVLREALLAEAVRGLIAIAEAAGGPPVLDVTPARDDYDERLSFSTPEVMVAALRTHFGMAPAQVGHALRAVGPAGAALLLVRAVDAGEQPYPVAQRGLDDGGVRSLLELVRLASELGRERAANQADSSLEASPQTGDSWRCIAGAARLALYRAPSKTIEDAAHQAARFVEAAPEHRPALPTRDIAAGMIWPPADGRHFLDQMLADAPGLEVTADGSWAGVAGGIRVHSYAGDVFPDAPSAQAALVAWAGWHSSANSRVSSQRCILAGEADGGTWRLWQIVRVERTLREELAQILSGADPSAVARGLIDLSSSFVDRQPALVALGVPCSASDVGFAGVTLAYVGLAPRPAPGEVAPEAGPAPPEERLRAAFAPIVAAHASAPDFDMLQVLRELVPAAVAAKREGVGEILAAMLIER